MRKSPKTVGRVSVSVTRQTAPESTSDVGLRCANPTYVLAGMSNTLFVSRYQAQLPRKKEMAAFLHKAVDELGGGDE